MERQGKCEPANSARGGHTGSNALRIVCISDTHNDDPRNDIPEGDIFIHAGDMTNDGTEKELQAAYDWIKSLPHKIKIVVAGNHDYGLDKAHTKYLPKSVELFTSQDALSNGIHYLNEEVLQIPSHLKEDEVARTLRVYGNPKQPEFLGKPYAFIYPPYPSEQSVAAWQGSPSAADAIDIWVTHSPPKDRLDAINVPPLTGCSVLCEKISESRPKLAVFGHYHYSWGVERVTWDENGNVASSQILTLSKERQEAEGSSIPICAKFDFTGNSDLRALGKDETIFVNAGYMTMKKRTTAYRNPPFVITLPCDAP